MKYVPTALHQNNIILHISEQLGSSPFFILKKKTIAEDNICK